jgi:hypothetical protein
MLAGDTFTLHDRNVDEHLWVVISDPLSDPSDPVVIVNLTSRTADKDPTCIVNPGEHPFVTHPTVVNYRDAKAVSNTDLEHLLGLNHLHSHEPLSPVVLSRIREGAARSKFIREGCRKILAKQGLIE